MRTILALLAIIASISSVSADDIDDFMARANKRYSLFTKRSEENYRAFRDSINDSYRRFLTEPWTPHPLLEPKTDPLRDIPPVISDPDPGPEENIPDNTPIEIDTIVVPDPIKEDLRPTLPSPILPREDEPMVDFPVNYCGTGFNVKVASDLKFRLGRVDTNCIDNIWETLSKSASADNMMASLLKEKDSRMLGDWAYYKLVEAFATSFIPDDHNAQNLLSAWILCQSGYRLRLAHSTDFSSLYVLPAVNAIFYGKSYWTFDNVNYYGLEPMPKTLCFIGGDFPGSRPMHMQTTGKEKFDVKQSDSRKIDIHNHPDKPVSIRFNLNKLAFYNEYPAWISSTDTPLTRWYGYANTRLSDTVTRQLYPHLEAMIAGKSEKESVDILMDFVESFPYMLDKDMWGVEDRAFFSEETLFYPFRDCEDGAILLTRLVRDLVGMPCALVYYPGHLAAAVAFNENVPGTYINYNDRRYVICDPTYYFVHAGVQMPSVDGSKAVLLPLQGK